MHSIVQGKTYANLSASKVGNILLSLQSQHLPAPTLSATSCCHMSSYRYLKLLCACTFSAPTSSHSVGNILLSHVQLLVLGVTICLYFLSTYQLPLCQQHPVQLPALGVIVCLYILSTY
ncbi:uncharacterized protein LOC119726805 [Patiria miniata]|uniref:Uncharacterized protein n=1 Tax=Patiria miniata TaxID=46514 RepID=A0A913ZTR3_PATMI|nr:uncharacterized protein LOC119726805 [Patiria miniata]